MCDIVDLENNIRREKSSSTIVTGRYNYFKSTLFKYHTIRDYKKKYKLNKDQFTRHFIRVPHLILKEW